MNIIETREVCKRYGNKEILHEASLYAKKGDVLGIIGPNGAGKSTLLRMINLIEKPFSGKIIFRGRDAGTLTGDQLLGARRRIGAVLQNPVLFRGSVEYNVGYGLWLRGIEDNRAVTDALNKVGLAGFEERRVQELSGGECQRVALARAIAFKPDLLLLDEPTANIDNKNAELIENAILEAGKKTAVMVSTHNLFQARRIADRTAFMDCGRILECKKTKVLFEDPDNPRTRRFVSGEVVF